MEHLQIHGNAEVPTVDFDPGTGRLLLSGESNLNDAAEFYYPLNIWLENYQYDGYKPVTMTFSFSYLNHSSQRQIQEIISRLFAIQNEGKQVEVLWYYHEGDEDMRELGETLLEDSELRYDVIRNSR